MRHFSVAIALVLALVCPAMAVTIAGLSNQEAVRGLKEALVLGADKAVSQLGTADGFLGNAKVRIPLPDSLRQAESVMRMVGMGAQADELITSMNRAAEMAVNEAKPLLVDAVKRMSVQDAKGILTGGDDAATQYFRRTTSDALTQRFLPIVKQMTARVNLAQLYNQYAGQAAAFGVIDPKDANIDNYVTRKALDGLFLVIAEQERAIRKDPVGAASNIVQKVFGAIGR
ncbi:MAG: DUF4197 domain-containing protein [Betaproteobacteria bacterium]|jgi:hypothetical protein|nr:DUF4197 domain-containing protein [Betaproteobacteria bacterium]